MAVWAHPSWPSLLLISNKALAMLLKLCLIWANRKSGALHPHKPSLTEMFFVVQH